MLTFNGYIPKRRGVLEHLRDGRLSVMNYVVFDLLLIWADANTGIATTNGPGLVFLSGNQLKLDTVQTSLRSLEAGKYIARPFYVQGQRGDQKIFIDKFVCTKGKLKGKVLSFAKTTDWQNPFYEDLTENPTESQPVNQCDNQPVNQPSNETLKTENGNRKKVSVRQDSTDASLDQLSESKTNTKPHVLNGREFAAAIGAVEVPPVESKNAASPPPNSATPRKAGDKYLLQDEWRKTIREVEVPACATDLMTPNFNDLAGLLEDTTDSVDRIIQVARWAMETSNYWFRKKEGMVRNSTDFRNAYPTMSKQFANYQKTTGAIA